VDVINDQKEGGKLSDLENHENLSLLSEEVQQLKVQIRTLQQVVKVNAGYDYLPKLRSKIGLNFWQLITIVLLILVIGGGGTLYIRSKLLTQNYINVLIDLASLYQISGENKDAVRVLDESITAGINDVHSLGRAGGMYLDLNRCD